MKIVSVLSLAIGGGAAFFLHGGEVAQEYKNMEIPTPTPVVIEKTYTIDSFFEGDSTIDAEVENILKTLSNEQKAGMVLMPAWEKSISVETVQSWKKNYYIGGVMILRDEFSKENINTIKLADPLPLFLAIDAEPSLLWKNFKNIDTQVPNTNQLTTKEKVDDAAQKIADQMNIYDIDINFAPVYDSGENTSIIGNRAFGKSSTDIQIFAGLFAEKLKQNNILATAKHFPGHGSVAGDSHYILPTLSGKLSELENFQSAIEKNIPLVMVGHLAVENNGLWDTSGLPATLSKKIVTDLLRNQLEFEGIIITDAMNMGAVKNIKNAEIKALQAGNDIILMPNNLAQTHAEILKKMQQDNDFRSIMEEKGKKILKMKLIRERMGE